MHVCMWRGVCTRTRGDGILTATGIRYDTHAWHGDGAAEYEYVGSDTYRMYVCVRTYVYGR